MALLHVNYYSHVLGMDMEMDVILPEQTRGQIGMEGHSDAVWKTLYLLHGMSDDHTIWQRRTSIERYAAEKGISVVMPTTYLGWYTDMYRGPRYFTALAVELPKLCRQMFPRMSPHREDTYAAGLSMGGYGALKFGLRAPETFSKVASLSGALNPFQIRKDRAVSPERLRLMENVFCSPSAMKGSFNDLFTAAEELRDAPLRPEIYLWCGTEDFLIGQNREMRAHLERLGYSLTYAESPGDHRWKYWDEKIQTVLDWLLPEKEGK